MADAKGLRVVGYFDCPGGGPDWSDRPDVRLAHCRPHL